MSSQLYIGNELVSPAIEREKPIIPPEPKYKLFDRVIDDSNNDIGMVVGFHTDIDNQKYAIICLNAKYRSSSGQYLERGGVVTDLPRYSRYWEIFNIKETATFCCDKIIEYAAKPISAGISNQGCSAVTNCRSKIFTIDGVQYYGQLPTLIELVKIFEWRTEINDSDPTADQYSSLILYNSGYWSSNQFDSDYAWGMDGSSLKFSKSNNMAVAPILEIPIEEQ